MEEISLTTRDGANTLQNNGIFQHPQPQLVVIRRISGEPFNNKALLTESQWLIKVTVTFFRRFG